MTHAKIEANRATGKDFFLPSEGETCFLALEGSDQATWLRKNGYDVVKHGDAGTHGFALTLCGVYVSTNGHVSYR